MDYAGGNVKWYIYFEKQHGSPPPQNKQNFYEIKQKWK